MEYIVKILDLKQVTHDVKSFKVEKPDDYHFIPGQATEASIHKPGLEEERRPFTFTSLNADDFLELTIKRYPDHHGITEQLHQLKIGDELIVRDVWGAIEYKGPGYFIAGGAGITPFISILRQLHADKQLAGNTLYFSNKTGEDIIYEQELREMIGDHAVFVLTREKKQGYVNGRIDNGFIKQRIVDFDRPFYICGPDQMVQDLNTTLETLGARPESLVFEK